MKCISGEPKSLKIMLDYNKGDVLILEENYMRIRPYIKSHPNLGLYICSVGNPESRCPNCGQKLTESHWRNKKVFYYTGVGRYNTFRCDCGYVGHSRSTQLSKKERDLLVTTCAR
jgi:hypothetical protein